ncbi:hypothetical protein ASG79_15815 [Arthrobacter sp. Soil761]|nr:hypothetical protein ASG79_15815 [Arthrobacter sp. Soil761]
MQCYRRGSLLAQGAKHSGPISSADVNDMDAAPVVSFRGQGLDEALQNVIGHGEKYQIGSGGSFSDR